MKSQNYKSVKINRINATRFIDWSRTMQAEGKATIGFGNIGKIISHNYLQKSIEQKVERKNLFN
jgi:hypothetical protein